MCFVPRGSYSSGALTTPNGGSARHIPHSTCIHFRNKHTYTCSNVQTHMNTYILIMHVPICQERIPYKNKPNADVTRQGCTHKVSAQSMKCPRKAVMRGIRPTDQPCFARVLNS